MALIDPQMENVVLATLLQELHKAMPLCIEAGMVSEVFHSEPNRAFYKHLMSLWSEGKPVDRFMISRSLKADGMLDAVGGTERLQELTHTHTSMVAMPQMVVGLKDLQDRREIHKVSKSAYEDVQGDEVSTGDIKAALGAIALKEGASRVETPTPVEMSREALNRAMNGKTIPTGFRAIDFTCGLLYPGDFLVIGGAAKAGKSILSANIAKNISRNKFVAVFTIELNRIEYWRRMICAEAGVTNRFWVEGPTGPDQEARINAAIERLNSHKMTIVDRAHEIEHAFAIAKMLKAKHGELGAVVIDYIQMFEPFLKGNPTRAEKVSHVSRLCKRAAVELECLVVGVSQLNDDGQSLDSRGVQRDANLMVNILPNDEGGRDVVSAYNRNGPMGIKLPMAPELHFNRFVDCGS